MRKSFWYRKSLLMNSGIIRLSSLSIFIKSILIVNIRLIPKYSSISRLLLNQFYTLTFHIPIDPLSLTISHSNLPICSTSSTLNLLLKRLNFLTPHNPSISSMEKYKRTIFTSIDLGIPRYWTFWVDRGICKEGCICTDGVESLRIQPNAQYSISKYSY